MRDEGGRASGPCVFGGREMIGSGVHEGVCGCVGSSRIIWARCVAWNPLTEVDGVPACRFMGVTPCRYSIAGVASSLHCRCVITDGVGGSAGGTSSRGAPGCVGAGSSSSDISSSTTSGRLVGADVQRAAEADEDGSFSSLPIGRCLPSTSSVTHDGRSCWIEEDGVTLPGSCQPLGPRDEGVEGTVKGFFQSIYPRSVLVCPPRSAARGWVAGWDHTDRVFLTEESPGPLRGNPQCNVRGTPRLPSPLHSSVCQRVDTPRCKAEPSQPSGGALAASLPDIGCWRLCYMRCFTQLTQQHPCCSVTERKAMS